MELKEEVRKDKKDEKQKKNTDSKFANFMKGITIEPMTVLISLHSNLVHIPQDQMLLYKTCMEDKYNVRYENLTGCLYLFMYWIWVR